MLPAVLAAALLLASSPSFDGEFFDPDDLEITISHTGSQIVAHSVDWEIRGVVTSPTHARLMWPWPTRPSALELQRRRTRTFALTG